MKMRDLFFKGTTSVLFCLVMVLFFGCAENKLKVAVEEVNKKCPVSLGAVGEMTSVVYEGDMVTFNFTLNEDFLDIDALASNPDNMKATILAGILNEKSKKMIEAMIDAGASFNMAFKGKKSGKEANVKLSPEELKEEVEKPAPTNEEKLKTAIASTNDQMPIDSGAGVIMTEMVDKGDVVYYMAKVNDMAAFKQIANSLEEVKNSQRTMFKLMDPSLKIFFKLIADTGKGLGYCYSVEGDDKTVEVVHTNAELKELLGE